MIVQNLRIPRVVRQRVSSFSFVLIGIGLLTIFYIIPILLLAWTSINFGQGGLFVNYRIATRGIYINIILQSFYYGLITAIISLMLSYTLSYYIVFYGRRKVLLLGIVILPFWVAYIVRYLGIQLFFFPTGPFVRIFGTDFGILFSQTSLLIGLTSVFIPFATLPIHNSLDSVDKSLIDASHILGAGRLQTFRSITFPLSMPGVIAGGMIVFILAAGSFLAPALLGGSEQTMIANVIAQTFNVSYNIELGAAIAIVYTIILVLMLVTFNSIIDIGEVFGEL